jgi:multisubunit Na+/H+ antiporter MnhF subunit
MSMWLLASLGLLPPLLVAVVGSGRGAVPNRLIAVELATSLATFLLVALTFVFDQASSIDLALCLAVLTLPGTMLLALFFERWL